MIRGYEHDDSQYVLVEDEERKKITPHSGRTMEIVAFVKEEQIDPIYFDSSYFALPEKDSEKAYALLLKALEDKNRAAIATVTRHQREYTVFIRPRDHGLTVHTMFFDNEIRRVEGYGKIDENIHLKPQEIKLAEQLVETLSEDFEPSKYHDTFQQNLRTLIESKQKGRTFVEVPKPGRAPVIDMMEALKRSVSQSEAANKNKPNRTRREHEGRLGELGDNSACVTSLDWIRTAQRENPLTHRSHLSTRADSLGL